SGTATRVAPGVVTTSDPVTVPEREHEAPAQLVDAEWLTVLPFEPVIDPDDEYWPGAVLLTSPDVVAVLPSGPVRLPV
ncbi:hypothetical protein QMO17_35675, partial [Klebsiella pneumoniae]|nr:hypothetical protein [Klebsiella pneumoniae]